MDNYKPIYNDFQQKEEGLEVIQVVTKQKNSKTGNFEALYHYYHSSTVIVGNL